MGSIKPLSLKCKICGGNLVNDYKSSSCICENCGNRWAMTDMIPRIEEYSHITDKIRRALELLSDSETSVNLGQALSLFKSAEEDCLKVPDEVSSDLLRICNEGQEHISILKLYSSGKNYYEKGDYNKARSCFEEIKDYKDSASYIEKCDAGVTASQKKRIPFAIIVGMVAPAGLAIFLHEAFGIHLAVCISAFLVISALLAYGIYRGGVFAIIVEIISFMLVVPLILFLIMAYGIHMDKSLALKIAIGVPILIVVIFVVLSEVKK